MWAIYYKCRATRCPGARRRTQWKSVLYHLRDGRRFPALPDDRAWELVSPLDKHDAAIEPLVEGVVQASENGSAITYLANGAIEANPAGNSNFTQVLSKREAAGWSSIDIAVPHNSETGQSIGAGEEYRLFSGDLSLGLVQPFGETSLSPEATERTIYIRDDRTGNYEPVVSQANVPLGTKFGREFPNGIVFRGATPDLRHIVFSSTVALVPTAGEEGLYEWTGGAIQLVSFLPDGGVASNPELGHENKDVTRAVSRDGSRVVWSEPENETHLYMRDLVNEQTLQLDTVQPGGSGAGEVRPVFQTASSNGSKVFFTDSQQLTAGSDAGFQNPDLYECEVVEIQEKLSCRLKDLTIDLNTGESAGVQGAVLGASEDGSFIYLIATGVLSSTETAVKEKALSGEDNLYVLHEEGGSWTTQFIAVLSPEDVNDWSMELTRHTSEASPSGRYLSFMSERPLTGYENRDASSSEPDEEVFLYDGDSNSLVCVSCNPSGARPNGILDSEEARPLVDRFGIWSGRWLGGSVPGYAPTDPTHGVYQPRYLADNGRVFFDSPDELVARDVNHKEDVYEYEPEGVGSCAGDSETFVVRLHGCVALLSSGVSSEESAFLDAGADGTDVFFLTAEGLVSRDVDGAFDIYDAHECTSASPCFIEPGVAPAACTTAESCRAAPTSQSSIFGPPPSASFTGPGNLGPLPTKPTSKLKPPTRAQLLARALRVCRMKTKKQKHASCEKQARKRYRQSRKANQSFAKTSIQLERRTK